MLLMLIGMNGWNGCKSANHTSRTLSLTLHTDSARWSVTDYEVEARAYEGRSSESGLYQVRLADSSGHVLARVGLGRLLLQQSRKQDILKLNVPYPERAREVLIYRMDGSSGHYTLKEQDPLVRWKIPG